MISRFSTLCSCGENQQLTDAPLYLGENAFVPHVDRRTGETCRGFIFDVGTPVNTADSDRPLVIGDVLHGYCGGWFGRDHYDCSRVEAIGVDWVVVRSIIHHDEVAFAAGVNVLGVLREFRVVKPHDVCKCSDDWWYS